MFNCPHCDEPVKAGEAEFHSAPYFMDLSSRHLKCPVCEKRIVVTKEFYYRELCNDFETELEIETKSFIRQQINKIKSLTQTFEESTNE